MDWPLFDLRLRYRNVRLRAMREDDLADLAAMLPPDVGHDPRLGLFPRLSDASNERRLFCQGCWLVVTGTTGRSRVTVDGLVALS